MKQQYLHGPLFLDEHTDIPALAQAILIRQQARAGRTPRQQIKPNPRVATGPTGQTVLLLGGGAALCTWRSMQNALELLQAQSSREVSP